MAEVKIEKYITDKQDIEELIKVAIRGFIYPCKVEIKVTGQEDPKYKD